MELDEGLRQELIELIRQGKPIPSSYKSLLFPLEAKQKEYELIYGCKEREEDILRDTWSVPFQPVKKFGIIKDDAWHNMLIFGDNLQALKHLKNLQEQGKLEKIRLVYIDPPFGTGDIYDAKGAPAYSAKLQGAEFLEFLRKRLIFLRELLADNGSIYVRIDYHFGHYVKVLMDEIFDKNNFQNEIVVNRTGRPTESITRFHTATDSIFFYTKSGSYLFHSFKKERENPQWLEMHLPGIRHPTERIIFSKKMQPPKGRHWALSQEIIEQYIREGKLKLKEREYVDLDGKKVREMPIVLQSPTRLVDSNWTDIPGYSQFWDFPTENSEQLLERIITASSNPGDLVLDCFAGSGTTGAVAEKLGRRWIMVDSSKLAIYTMIKRIYNLKQEISNKGRPLKPKPFVLYNAGLYEDHDFILKIGEEHYKNFALELFQAEPKDFEINGLKMDGLLFNCPVKVFSQKGYLTEEYIDELHNTVGEYLKARMFVIAPASRVYFLQDYIEKDGTRYYILRIPYSVIDELHDRPFKRPLQPKSLSEINQNIDQIGFDFIHQPKLKSKYSIEKPKDELYDYAVIKIKEFEAVQRSKEPIEFVDSKEALSMVLVDLDYNGEYFNISHKFFADEIKKEDYKVKIFNPKLGEKIAIIYIDVLGNELIEVKSKKDFKRTG